MATNRSTIDYILEQAAGAGHVSARAMFGEFALYCDGKLVALVCNGELFVKPTVTGRAHIESVVERPPYPGAKPCFWIDGEHCEDGDWLAALIKLTAAELPLPKPKKAKVQNTPKH